MATAAASENMASREMRGGGYYTQSTRGCFDVIANAQPTILKQIDDMALPADRPFVVMDLGAADGGTSMHLVRAVIEKVRSKNADQEVTVLYEDQPTNDFKPLFLMTQGLMSGPESYLKQFPNKVFVQATGTSFYEQCAPSSSVQLEVSFTAMHWLRRTPRPIANALHSVMASEEERAAYAEQAAKDWEQNLLMRAAELAPGSRAVFVNFCVDEGGRYLGNTASADGPKTNMHALFDSLWKQMEKEGRITADEYRATNFPQHYRTVEEFVAPLRDSESAISKAGVRLVSADTRITRCPYAAGFKEGKYADAKAFAKDFVPTLRSWSSGVFLTGLSDERSALDKQAIVDEFYKRYEDVVAANPEEHGMEFVHVYLVLARD